MIGDNFFLLNSVESTNNYAMAKVHAGMANHGDVYIAREQTAGKGQRGRSWYAEPGQNITMSVVFRMQDLFGARPFLLSAAVALSIYDLFSKIVDTDVKIKWPNDLYWRDRKAAGILIENLIKGEHWQYAVAGIGININQSRFTTLLPKPVSLKQITGKDWEVNDLAQELCQLLDHRWQQLCNNHTEAILRDYNSALYKKGEKVRLKKNNIRFDAVIREVNQEGELITENLGWNYYKPGELQWII